MGLTFVPTPLGNLRDITLRAIDSLKESSLVVCEDSRVTRKLLSALEITGKELWTYHEHNAAAVTAGILERARNEKVAVVTDAGTPGISDPGSALVGAARAVGIGVEVLPGPAAFVCAAVLSGFDLRGFSFEGFAPRAEAARHELFSRAVRRATSVWYESPHRIHATLNAIATVAPAARVFVARELTKRFEQQLLGTASAVAHLLERPVRGEIVLVLEGSRAPVEPLGETALDERIDRLLEAGASVSTIAKTLAEEGAGERRPLYARVTERKRALQDGLSTR